MACPLAVFVDEPDLENLTNSYVENRVIAYFFGNCLRRRCSLTSGVEALSSSTAQAGQRRS